MKKNYLKWTRRKRFLNNHGVRIKDFREGNLYWAFIGENIGMEQDGSGNAFSRPALVLNKMGRTLVLCVPISSKKKNGKYYMDIDVDPIHGTLLFNQVKVIDVLRLGDLIGVVPHRILRKSRHKLTKLIRK